MWQVQGRHGSTGLARRFRRRGGDFEAHLAAHSFPSSNGEDSGTSSRECRFNSGRERHGDVAQRTEHSPCKRMDLGLSPIVSTFSILAVAQRLARPVRNGEAAGSSPAGETNTTPVAQWMSETLRTSRSRVRILPGVPLSNDAVTQRPRVLACLARGRGAGSIPASVAIIFTARNSTGRVADS